MAKIHVLHENAEWVVPLEAAFREQRLAYELWFLEEGSVDLAASPPAGVFYNRMSASSHTWGHRFAPELTHVVLNWLERHGRRVVNSSRALYLEISKVTQYTALERAGIAVPRTVAAVGREQALEAARALRRDAVHSQAQPRAKGWACSCSRPSMCSPPSSTLRARRPRSTASG